MAASTNTLPARQGGAASLVARARHALQGPQSPMAQPALRRALPAIGLLLAVVVGLAAWILLTPPDRVALQSGLPVAEKSRALEALGAQGVDARLDPSSGMLTVPKADFHRARMLLATEGLPQGTADGLSVISEMPMGTSRQVESARLRRMQELDLARSITELQQVRAARVHLALPERSAFVRDSQPPRASVFVELAPGMSLSEDQVRAIVSLVATGVNDMPRSNVSVVDQSGTLLTRQDEDPLQAEADRHLRHQRRLEQVYRDRVLSLLTPMVGPGKAAVEVTLDMDFTRAEITREEFLPDTALRSEQNSRTATSGLPERGVPGAIANAPPQEPELEDAAEAESAGATTNTSETATRNFEVGRQVETRRPQTARILRVHAAVLLDSPQAPANAAGEGDGETAQAPATPPLAEIEALTKSAIAFDGARGDVVTVTAAPFVSGPDPMTAPSWHEASWLPDLGRVAAQLALVGILVLGVVRPILNRLLPPVPTAGSEALSLGNAVEVPRGETMMALRERLDTAGPDADDLNAAISYEEKVDLLRQMANSETNRIAGAFKTMLTPADEDRT